ncbi:ATPase, AAA family protein [Tritrichomonas foetus]|uniref:ATPase, AAA family protein n=1 Tax=Tritrichomonas foetus TaxID=1144522 RepID=A0A1J4L1E3_9EUKA|nr:ATPase, AAA family protein [Tritrichomonas foetus]|eukprot:OHT16888.1 ATPase, AAA family protein [Tritrichomonas foetus]
MTENSPWVEKYRPQKIDDIVQQDEVVNALRSTLDKGDLPHLLFHGPPGTGKTSTAVALCRSLFKPTEMKRRVMELNASDDRGIDAVRSKVKQFASLAVPSGGVPYKIVILDEADSMTRDAQNALRRVIEQYSAVTRFIIICNYVSKIIDPILSRCAKFRFKSLEKDAIIGRLQYIVSQESLEIDGDDVYETLVDISGGDLRKAITFLQSSASAGTLTSTMLREISGSPEPTVVEAFFEACVNKQWPEIERLTLDLVYSGYDVSQVLEMLCNIVITTGLIQERKKPELLMKIAAADGMINARADPEIQFTAIAAAINAFK